MKKLNIVIALIILIFSIFWLVNDGFEPNSQIVFLLISIVFLSFGIEKIKDGMKRTGFLYLGVFLISFVAAISSL